MEELFNDLNKRMEKSIQTLLSDFGSLRTGRASGALLDKVVVEVYGSKMPINQLVTVNIPEARTLSLQVWESTLTKAVEKAILESDLGLTPIADGNVIRINLPELNQERRKELLKVAGKYAEQARIAIRNIRKDGISKLKVSEKNKEISEDQLHQVIDKIQKMTDQHIGKIDSILKAKESDIMKV